MTLSFLLIHSVSDVLASETECINKKLSHKRFRDQIKQWFNKCKIYNTSGSGGIKKGQKIYFVEAWPIQGVLYQNIDQLRE